VKITAIKQQVKRAGRYSIFVDEKYAFSLSESALLAHKLASGQEMTKEQLSAFKKISAEDKLYNLTLRYVAMRLRSRWEVETYLTRKDASPTLIEEILNKLSNIGMLDDKKLAQAYISDRQLLRPTSRRKIINGLRQKRVAEDIINEVVEAETEGDSSALRTVIERKRQQSKYQDDLKLMQYLARQGFNYGDIKTALQTPED
jgi:regulatory protein